MYVAPESYVLYALAAVAETSNTEPSDELEADNWA